MRTLRVAVPFPNHSDITAPCRNSLFELIKASQRGELPFNVQLKTAQCSRISLGRNDLINDGKSRQEVQTEFDFDRILFIDADQSFSVHDVVALWDMYDRASKQYGCVVTGVTNPRNFTEKLNVGLFAEDGYTTPFDRMLDSDCDKNIYNVDWCGAAFLMIDSDILRVIKYPWFEEKYVTIEGFVNSIGEDVMFCKKLKDAEIKVFANTNIFVEHHFDNASHTSTSKSKEFIESWFAESVNMMMGYLNHTKTEFEKNL